MKLKDYSSFKTSEYSYIINRYILPISFIGGSLAMFSATTYVATLPGNFQSTLPFLAISMALFILFLNLFRKQIFNLYKIEIKKKGVLIGGNFYPYESITQVKQFGVFRIEIKIKHNKIDQSLCVPLPISMTEGREWPEDCQFVKFLKSKTKTP